MTQSFRFGYEIATIADSILRDLKSNRRNERRERQIFGSPTLIGVGCKGEITGKDDDINHPKLQEKFIFYFSFLQLKGCNYFDFAVTLLPLSRSVVCCCFVLLEINKPN